MNRRQKTHGVRKQKRCTKYLFDLQNQFISLLHPDNEEEKKLLQVEK